MALLFGYTSLFQVHVAIELMLLDVVGHSLRHKEAHGMILHTAPAHSIPVRHGRPLQLMSVAVMSTELDMDSPNSS